MNYFFKSMPSPVGVLKLVASDKGLAAILWEDDDPDRVRLGEMEEKDGHPLLLETERQLKAYFAGKLDRFSVPLDFKGTDFQKQVWHALVTIPFGETRSYGEIASQIGNRKRCARSARRTEKPDLDHRAMPPVIGANGKLTGFAGGLEVKAKLLALEGSERTLL